jgi:hypothetical protein
MIKAHNIEILHKRCYNYDLEYSIPVRTFKSKEEYIPVFRPVYGQSGVAYQDVAKLFISRVMTEQGVTGDYRLTVWDPFGKRFTVSYSMPVPLRRRFSLLKWLPKFLDRITVQSDVYFEVENISIVDNGSPNIRVVSAVVAGTQLSAEVTVEQNS